MKMLNQSLIDGSPSYVLGFRFFHLEGVSDELVQLIGAVMNLDLDTILDILHNISSAEVVSISGIPVSVMSMRSMCIGHFPGFGCVKALQSEESNR